MKRILVVAAHPDDETLGCGGTMLRERAAGNEVYWLIATSLTESSGFSLEQAAVRAKEIEEVAAAYDVTETVQLGFPTARLDNLPMLEIVSAFAKAVSRIAPTDVYLPFPGDAHSDHGVVFDAGASTSKWFRYPSVRRVLTYETMSETDFDLSADAVGFRPNVFVDITDWLPDKIRIMQIYASELGEHPFPRSNDGMRALATVRGAASGFVAAESFVLLRERVT